MNEMMRYESMNEMQTRQITGSLFEEFVAWIDRTPATTRTYLTNLKQFAAYLAANEITWPTRQDILSYRQALLDSGRKPNTVTAYLRSVKQFFAWTAANGYYPDVAANVHAPKVDHSTHRKDALTAPEVLDIEKSITARAAQGAQEAQEANKDRAGRIQRTGEQGKRLYAMYLLAVNAGLRTIELNRANVGDIETRGGQTWLYVWGKGKTEACQKKPLAPEVAEAIREYLASRTDSPAKESPLFVSTGNRAGGKRIATTTISTMLKRAMQEAGYDSERITAHSLRHTAGTAVQEITGDLYQTQQYMRHANPATTEIYLHNDTEQQEAQTAARLYDYYHGQTKAAENPLQGLTAEQIRQLLTLAQYAGMMAATR